MLITITILNAIKGKSNLSCLDFTSVFRIFIILEKQVFQTKAVVVYKFRCLDRRIDIQACKRYKNVSYLFEVSYTCNKRDIGGIKWPISLRNSHRIFSQFVIYTSSPKDLISLKYFMLGTKV